MEKMENIEKLKKTVMRILFYLLVFVVTVIVFFPFYWLVNTSLLDEAELFKNPPNFYPSKNVFGSYLGYIVNSPILLWLKNSFIVSTAATVISTIFAVFGAYSISRFTYRGRVPVIFAVLLTQMLPRVLLVIPIYTIFLQFKLNNTLIGLTLMYTVITVPIGLWFVKGFFDSIPKELEESAIIDGCSRFNALLKIIVPLSTPGIMATATWSYIIAWDEYLFAHTLISSEKLWPVSVGLSSHIGQYSILWGEIMVGAVLATLPIGILFMFFQKYLVTGLLSGSVKG